MSDGVQHITRQLTQLGGWNVTEDCFEAETPVGRRRFANIVAVFGGEQASGSGSEWSRLTLACHYDSKRFDSMRFIGASDAAASCAIMIQLARCLTDSLRDALNDTAHSPVSSQFAPQLQLMF